MAEKKSSPFGRAAPCERAHASPDGIPATFPMGENANAADNACFSLVSMRSDEIKNMGRFFPPRYFRQGDAVECGSWLDEQVLDDAILDAKKSGRIAGTIAASVGGAVVGVGITELLGQKFGAGIGFEGQLDYQKESQELLSSLKHDRNSGNAKAYEKYEAEIKNLVALCEKATLTGDTPDVADARDACATAKRIYETMKLI